MTLLRRKLVRDIAANRWLFTAVTSVVLLGVCLFDAAYMSFQNLSSSYDLTYDRLRFADFTTRFHSGPEALENRARAIPGVAQAYGRLSQEIELAQTGRESEKVVGRVLAVPDQGPPDVNAVLVLDGAMPSPRRRELLLERNFAEANGYRPGDTITPVILDEEVEFTVSGIAASPEYILAVRAKEYLMPQPEEFGALFTTRTQAEELLGAPGTINELCVTITQYADRERVIQAVEDLVRPYGFEETITRDDQPSNNLLQSDLRAFRELAVIFPAFFLVIAALTVYTLLTRMVRSQRTQIGFMRASGYSSSEILVHYLEFALVLGLLGATIGTIAGHGLGIISTHYYTRVVGVPFLDMRPRWGSMSVGWMAGLVVALLAGIVPARAAAQLQPAETMRTETPAARRSWALRVLGRSFGGLPYVARLPLRNLIRRPRRTAYTALGIASAIALVIVSLGMLDASYAAINMYFYDVQVYDLRVSFLDPQPWSRLARIGHWEGVERVEPGLMIPVELQFDGKSYFTVVLGLPRDSRLYRLYDPRGESLSPPPAGMLIGATARSKLDAHTGDTLRVRLPEEPPDVQRWHNVQVVGYVHQPVGGLVYMSLDQLRRVFGRDLDLPRNGVTGAIIAVDPRYTSHVRDRLFDLTGAVEAESTAQTRAQIEELMKLFYAYLGIMLSFGIALAVAILFNTATIGVLERSRELASLRSLGMTRRQVGLMVTIENAVTALGGSLLGMGLGRLLNIYFIAAYSGEQLQLRPVIYPQSYAITVAAAFIALIIAQIPALRAVNRLDLAKATKEFVS
ncbi:MAG: FtsX-like permease family protein [Armatimonadota bacterium]|nr:MAG: FtsX-like permease family protein [Armatimonadota bacterium]